MCIRDSTWAILLSYLNTFMNTTLTAMNQVKAILYILIVAVAVSYTHLDVYKRQTRKCRSPLTSP